MTTRLRLLVGATAAWALACALDARELQTVYSVGRYRVKTPAELAQAVKDMAAASFDTRAAVQLTEQSARQFLYAEPRLGKIDVAIEQARANNRLNTDLARRTLDLALSYTISGKQRYKTKAVANFAAFVLFFPTARTANGVEKEHKYHTLYARDWLPELACAYDLLHDSLAPNEQQSIDRWLRDMVEFIAKPATWERWKHTTHGAWHAAALGIVGAATGDPQLKKLAHDRIRYHLEKVVGGDGAWPGGSLELQYTVTRAYLAYAEAAMASDNVYTWRNSRGESYLKRMLDVPLMLVDPFGAIPGSHHLGTEPPPADIYLLAALRYRDPLYASFARMTMTNMPPWRLLLHNDVYARLPVPEARPIYSAVSPTLGWAVLRTGGSMPARELYARLDYGTHGGSSGHADKLALYLCGMGKHVTSDDDTYDPASPMMGGWAKQTLAHNTVMINYRSQIGASSPSDSHGASGTLLMFDRTPSISIVEADARAAYPFAPLAGYRRCVAMTGNYIVDVFNIYAAKPVTADWVFNGLGRNAVVERATKGEASLNNDSVRSSILGGTSQGYEWIDDVTTYTANEQWAISWPSGLRTIMMGQPGTQLITGRSGGSASFDGEIVTHRSYTQTTVIARRNNVIDTRFVALHEIMTGPKPKILSFARLDTGSETLVLEIVGPDYKDLVIFQPRKNVQDLIVDQTHRVTTEQRRYAYVRFARPGGAVVDSVNLSVSRPE